MPIMPPTLANGKICYVEIPAILAFTKNPARRVGTADVPGSGLECDLLKKAAWFYPQNMGYARAPIL
jgi:hypothetical protein